MYRRILVPIDGSATSFLGLQEALKLAESSPATLRLVHVVNEFLMSDVMYFPADHYDKLIEPLREAGRRVLENARRITRERGLEAQAVMLETIGGRAADLILTDARTWPADLIVMGTHGRRGLSRMVLGSDAELVLRGSPVPVLLVRGTPESA
jgi:nucleotide-binding universal stress UspA family protein